MHVLGLILVSRSGFPCIQAPDSRIALCFVQFYLKVLVVLQKPRVLFLILYRFYGKHSAQHKQERVDYGEPLYQSVYPFCFLIYKITYLRFLRFILSRCHSSSTYSCIVRSDENFPVAATFSIAFLAHSFSFL